MNYMKIQFFESEIKELDDKNQILMLYESEKVSGWWAGFFIAGLGQMIQGRIGRGLGFLFGTGLVGAATFGLGGLLIYIWAWYDAYSYERDTNNHMVLAANKRIRDIREIEDFSKLSSTTNGEL